MQQDVVTVGVDLARKVFQVHAIGVDGTVLVRRQLRRGEVVKFFSSLPPCLVGMDPIASGRLRVGNRAQQKKCERQVDAPVRP